MEETSRFFFARFRRNNGTWMKKATRLPVNLVSTKTGPQAIFYVSNWKCSLEYFLQYFTEIVKSNVIFLLKENTFHSILLLRLSLNSLDRVQSIAKDLDSASLRKPVRTWNILRYAWLICEINLWILSYGLSSDRIL